MNPTPAMTHPASDDAGARSGGRTDRFVITRPASTARRDVVEHRTGTVLIVETGRAVGRRSVDGDRGCAPPWQTRYGVQLSSNVGRVPRPATTDALTHDVEPDQAGWTFLTNHGHVLVCIALDPDVLLSEIAERVGIRERAAHRIVTELVDAGYVRRERVGRRNHYTIDPRLPLRHPLEREHIIGELLSAVATPPAPPEAGRRRAVR